MGTATRRALVASAPAIALGGLSAPAQQMKITLGTAMEGGGAAAYGAAFVTALRSVDPTFEIRPVPTKGILDNVSRLDSGELDIGLVFGEVAHELFMGIGRPASKLKVVSVMYSTPGMFVVRADTRYRRIADLKGQPVVWNGASSGLAVQARYAMDGLGLDIDADFQAIYTDSLADGPPLVINGRAAALWGAGVRWPGFVKVAGNPRGARFVVPNASEIERIHARHSFLTRLTVPGGLYPGQHDPIVTVGSWSFILARADLDDPIGHRLAAALYKVERAGTLSKPLAETTVKNTLAAISGPEMLQPGAARFYRESGLLK
jgi:TRAP transporter TAXI family solute receptor